MACFGRIQSFLITQSREDLRQRRQKTSSSSSDTAQEEVVSVEPILVDISAAILIDALTICPAAGHEAVLSNITIGLEAASITMIAGPIGSGKSTLLKAILGEVPFTGEISVSSRQIGYCAQTTWLLNGTIRENVIGLANNPDIDETWYRTVVHACALDEDIALLAEGDQTLIGSRGLNLSGGQRQRLVSTP
jgi:ATP-binding cassette, subfamily C (CFTR/MRP), member 1